MGVDLYQPRYALKGALPTSDPWPQTGGADTPQGPADGKQDLAVQGKPVSKLLDELQQDLDGSTEKPARIAPDKVVAEEKPSTVVPAAVEEVSYGVLHLSIFQPAPGLLMLNPAEGVHNEHLKLLRNILRALGRQVSDIPVPLDSFHWPPRGSGDMTGAFGVEAARETLHSLLEGYQQRYSIDVLVLMGESLQELLFPEKEQSGELFEAIDLHGMSVRAVPSLQHMLDHPMSKHQAWQVLKSLSLDVVQ
jgi:hypothetical protein